jgi:HlyD family secretion protein
MNRKVALVLLLLTAIAIGIYFYFVPHESEIVLTGIVTTDDVIVSAQIAGRLETLKVKQGDTVKKGDTLAIIQPAAQQADMAYYENTQQQAATQVAQSESELRFQELQSQNQILQAQSNLASAEAQVKQAEAELENATLTFRRTDELYKKGVETIQAFDQARTTRDALTARLDSLRKLAQSAKAALDLAKSTQEQIAMRRAGVDMNKHQLAAVRAQRDKAKVQLDYTEIKAPIDGIVDVRAALQGEVVNPAQAIVTIINPDDLWIRADVEETYIDRIKLGDKLNVKLPSGATRESVVFYRAADADYATQRDVSRTKRDIRTFEIRLRCDNKDRALAVGMTAYVTLPLAKNDGTPTTSTR